MCLRLCLCLCVCIYYLGEYAIVRTVCTVYLPVCAPVRSLAHTYTSTHQSMSSLVFESTNHSESEMLVRGFEWRSHQSLVQSHFVRQPLQIFTSRSKFSALQIFRLCDTQGTNIWSHVLHAHRHFPHREQSIGRKIVSHRCAYMHECQCASGAVL